jgi:DNA-binding transcriptional MerR regulator
MSRFTIGEVATRTGTSVATLRAWERRYGFPRPQRREGGHRRYSDQDVALLQRVAEERGRGLSVAAAIDRATAASTGPPRSVFAALRSLRPQISPQQLRKPELLRLSRAIEDESCARAERAILLGGFQDARHFRSSERRWRDLSRTAETTVVYAEFKRPRLTGRGPAEVPVGRGDPLSREWMVICDAPSHAACLAGWELPGQGAGPERDRLFEALWSVEPQAVRDAARIAGELAAERAPALSKRVLESLARRPLAPLEQQLRLAAAITARALSASGARPD